MTLPCYVRRLDAPDPEDSGPISKFGFDLVLSSSLAPGDLVLCCAGELVPADGSIVEGVMCFEHAPGASPILAARSSRRVLAGTRLRSGYLILRVDRSWTVCPPASRVGPRNLHGMFMRLVLYFDRSTRAHDLI